MGLHIEPKRLAVARWRACECTTGPLLKAVAAAWSASPVDVALTSRYGKLLCLALSATCNRASLNAMTSQLATALQVGTSLGANAMIEWRQGCYCCSCRPDSSSSCVIGHASCCFDAGQPGVNSENSSDCQDCLVSACSRKGKMKPAEAGALYRLVPGTGRSSSELNENSTP